MPRLDLTNAEGVGTWVEMTRSRNVLGRDPSCQVVLHDKSVSRRHAEILFREGAYWVKDLGSTNGTLINGRVVDYARLLDGDSITLGIYSIVFRDNQSGDLATEAPVSERSEHDPFENALSDLEEVLSLLYEGSGKLDEGLQSHSMETLEAGAMNVRLATRQLTDVLRKTGSFPLGGTTVILKREK